MDGVTILQTLTQTTYNWHWTDWCTACATMTGISVIGWLICSLIQKDLKAHRDPRARIAEKATVLFIILACVSISGTITAARFGEKVETTTYQVLLDNNVHISEFRTQYEILEEQGITYIVRERN